MQLDLAPETENRLEQEARLRGISLPELFDLLLDHAPLGSASIPTSPGPVATENSRRKVLIEDHIAWMKSTSPDWETANPQDIDWQAIKAEGRRF